MMANLNARLREIFKRRQGHMRYLHLSAVTGLLTRFKEIFKGEYVCMKCPYCIADIYVQDNSRVMKCPKCGGEIPVQYVEDYISQLPFFVQVVGWSRVGKTVFLSALSLMLRKMSNIWEDSYCVPITDASRRKIEEIDKYLVKGKMPKMTSLGDRETYMMLMNNMKLWGSRTLVMRDCAGRIFDTMKIPEEQAPFLLKTPTALMLISIPDLMKSENRSMDILLNNYINTLMHGNIDFKKKRHNLVVVLTKGDLIENLPPNLFNYLASDPLWMAVNSADISKSLSAADMERYVETMGRVSEYIREWFPTLPQGQSFLNLAKKKNIGLRFCIISSTGSLAGEDRTMPLALAPKRVLDPYFWALELQSMKETK